MVSHHDRPCSTTIRVRDAAAPADGDRGELSRWPRQEIQLHSHQVVAHTPRGDIQISSRTQLEQLEVTYGRIPVTITGPDGPAAAVSATARASRLAGRRRASVTGVRPRLDVVGSSADAARVRSIAADVAAAGGRAVVVGGAVRDAVAHTCGIGVPGGGKDLDVEVFGVPPHQLEALLRSRFTVDETGKSFAVYKIGGSDIDVSLPRRETKTGAGHRGFDVVPDPTMTLEQAAQRRDFTINAMSYDPLTGELLDPTGGAGDLAARRLRVVSAAFDEDPLRVLRGAQFIARFALGATSDTVARSRSLRSEAATLPRERVWGEWEKLLARGVAPGDGVRFLDDTGWLDTAGGLDGARDHATTIAERLDRWAERTALHGPSRVAAGMCVLLSVFDDAGERASQFSPIVAHARTVRVVSPVAAAAAQIEAVTGGEFDAQVRRLAARCGGVRVWCDVAGGVAAEHVADRVLGRAVELGVADAAPERLVTGDDLIAAGVTPGPELGRMLAAAYEAQLDGHVTDTAAGVAAALAARDRLTHARLSDRGHA